MTSAVAAGTLNSSRLDCAMLFCSVKKRAVLHTMLVDKTPTEFSNESALSSISTFQEKKKKESHNSALQQGSTAGIHSGDGIGAT